MEILQQQVLNLLSSNSSFENEFMPTEKYNIKVTRKDGSSIQITGSYDDLSIAVKYMDSTIQTAGIRYLFDTKHRETGLTDITINRIYGYMGDYYKAFEESRHVNTK